MRDCLEAWMLIVVIIKMVGILISFLITLMNLPRQCLSSWKQADLKEVVSIFDAKIRRNSTDPADLFYAHIGGMDAMARALTIADNILNKSDYKKLREERYASFDKGNGKAFEEGKLTLEDLRNLAAESGEPAVKSGKQEYFENLIN